MSEQDSRTNYIPEINYYENGFKPVGIPKTDADGNPIVIVNSKGDEQKIVSPPWPDMCGHCEEYYAMLYEKQITNTPFPPRCQKHILNQLNFLDKADYETEEEYNEAQILLDPVAWVEQEFNMTPFWYQEFYLSCTAELKLMRLGRRSGKCLVEGTEVLTPSGPVAIESLSPGDTVYSENGEEIKVKEVFDQGIQEVVDLCSNGTVMATCTINHPWLTVNQDVSKVTETRNLIGDCKIVRLNPNNFSPDSVGVSIRNPRKAQCYDIHVDSDTNLYLLANGLVTHNTQSMIFETLHFLYTHKGATVLMCAPRENQVTYFFDEIEKLIMESTSLNGSLSRYVKSPSRIEFKNKSKILGFTLNPNQGASVGVNIRGQDADLIVCDEISFISEEALDILFAIKASHPKTKIIAATTPSGQRDKFYQMCVSKNIGWKEWWLIAAESPKYFDYVEEFFRNTFSEAKYTHEVLADFGEPEEGVFKKHHIDAALQNYDMTYIQPDANGLYLLGVDWNKTYGTHMVIIQRLGNQLKLVGKVIIPEAEYMQTEAVKLIIDLHSKWKFKYIFVDAGYGSVQVELLKKHGTKYPSTGLHRIVKPITMNKILNIKDPVSGQDVKKFTKPFLVQQTAKLLEDRNLILPASEDTNIVGSDQGVGLVQQMRNYRVVNISVYGQPQYTKEGEHTLVAYMIACGGYIQEDGELARVGYDNSIRAIVVDGTTEKFPTISEPWSEAQYRDYIKSTKQQHPGVPVRDLDAGKSKILKKGMGNLGEFRKKRGADRSSKNSSDFRRKTF